MNGSAQPRPHVAGTSGTPLGSASPVIVLGANGLVGSRIVARLVREVRVVAVARGPARGETKALLAQTSDDRPPENDESLQRGLEYVDLDLALDSELRDLIESRRPSAVVHAAAMTDVDACERDPVLAWQLNARTVEAAALACREVGARLLSLSTDYVFDGEAGPYDEAALPNPRGAYAISKRVGEEAALLLARDVAVCRVAVIFSGRRGAKRTFAVACAEALLAGKEVKAFHDQFVSPTLADDAAQSCIAVLRSGAQGIFHCSGADVVSRVDFCQRLAHRLGADPKLVVPVALADVKLLAPRPKQCGLLVDKVRALGVRPLTVDEALDAFLRERAEAAA